jgi:predicted dehydrogenase
MPFSYRAAIFGCGWAGFRHACAFPPEVEIGWLVDTNVERAVALRQKLGGSARVSIDYHDALADPLVDAVDICLPHSLHAPAAVAAARAGKHILCEKPLAATLEEADAMIAAARHAGVILMVAENVRFDPAILKIKELVEQGVIGKVTLLQITRQCYLRRSFIEERPWFLDARAAAGGALMSGGVHDFEKARMLVGEVKLVYALRAPQRFLELEGDDTSIVAVRFENSAVGTFVLTFLMKSLATAAGNEVHTIRLDGELGSIMLEDGHTIRVFSEHPAWQNGQSLIAHEIHVPAFDTFQLEIAHFLDCIKTGQEPVTSGVEERKPLAAVLAAYHSIETGLPTLV